MGAWWISNYDEAKTFLSKGRKSWDRPMYMRGLRLQKRSNGSIAILDRWAGFDPVTFHPDGTLTIQAPTTTTQWGSWNTLNSQTVRRNIRDFSGLQHCFKRDGVVYIVEQNATLTPPKVQKCRVCKGKGKVDSYCYPDYCNKSWPCPDHPHWEPDDKKKTYYWHYGTCEHGNVDSHKVLLGQTCRSCQGEGKRDYGSQYVKIAWDGSPLRLLNGKLIKQAPTELEKAIAAYVKPSVSA